MDKEIKKIIGSVAKEITDMMGFDCNVSVDEVKEEDGEESIVCNLITDTESNFLIGQNGDNLQALQHIIRLIVRNKTDERIKFSIDINSYKEEKNNSIVDLARDMAKRAVLERKAMVLRPMSAYERRLVHMELSENDSVDTESIGEGEERKIVIKPTSQI